MTMTPEQIEQQAAALGMANPRRARITREVKTKFGRAFSRSEIVTVYESGKITSGHHVGQQGFVAFSVSNQLMTAILPSHFVFEEQQ